MDFLNNHIKSLMKTRDEHEHTINELRQQIESDPKMDPHSVSMKKWDEEYKNLGTELVNARSKADQQAAHQRKKSHVLQERVAALEASNGTRNQALEESITALEEQLEEKESGEHGPEKDAEAFTRLEDTMTLELNRMREDAQTKTMLLKAKDAELEELHTKLESLQGDKNQKLEYLEHLMKEREMALSQLREQSDLQIRNLQEELLMKDETLRIDRERLEAEVDGFRRKALDLERQYSELSDERRQMQNLQEQVNELSKDLETAQKEARAAVASKVQTVQHLANEMERIRDNYGNLIYIKRKNFDYLDA